MISEETYEAIMENKDVLDSAIIYDRDFQYNYVSFSSSNPWSAWPRLSNPSDRERVDSRESSLVSRPSSDLTCSESTARSPSVLST